MTRDLFLAQLRLGLDGVPKSTLDEIIADYETHFADGVAAGRTEAEVAEALGDPRRLARELRAEAGVKAWKEEKTPTAAAGAVFAVLGLGAIDILILLPILLGVVGALFGFYVAAVAIFFAGGAVFAAGPFMDFPGGIVSAIFAGIGLMAGAASLGGVLTLITIGLINALVWYGRLHYRLLKPALEPQA